MTPSESRAEPATPTATATEALPESYDLLADDGSVLMKNNRLTIDDATRQKLTHQEIEDLKKSAGSKEVIERILANHAGLDEKTAYSKAKYTLRKHKKYLKRFVAMPMDLQSLMEYVLEKEAARIMEIREESLGLVGSWSNAHYSGTDGLNTGGNEKDLGGRWLVCDDTGGLLTAALAERMNLLHLPQKEEAHEPTADVTMAEAPQTNGDAKTTRPAHKDFPIPATTNTITVLHPAVQPNLSLLKYFGYDTSNPNAMQESDRPLHTHLKPLSWLQLLHPNEDPTYTEPEVVSDATLATWKSGKRGTYYKKRRRWERCRTIVDETREGGFEGLVIASHMDAVTILEHAIPLVRGGGHVVIYSPTIEPLVKIVDLYSKERRSAYIAHISKGETPTKDDFPLDPRLLLAPSVQTSRVRGWQVLPGRTHPLMTSRGGAEGFVFTARRVIPLEGGVEARGNFGSKKRKTEKQAMEIDDKVAQASPAPVNALFNTAEEAAET